MTLLNGVGEGCVRVEGEEMMCSWQEEETFHFADLGCKGFISRLASAGVALASGSCAEKKRSREILKKRFFNLMRSSPTRCRVARARSIAPGRQRGGEN